MSLLIDALRRADEAKRAAAQGGESAPAGEGISLAPLETTDAAASRDELQKELKALDDSPSKNSAARPAPFGQTADQNGARNLFAAKGSDSRKGFNLAIGALTIAALLGIGGYFWWQLRPSAGGLVAIAPQRPKAPPPPVRQEDIAPRIIPLDAAPAPARAETRVAQHERPRPVPPTSEPTRGSFGDARTPAPRTAQPTEPLRASIPIRRGVSTPAVSPRLQDAWRAYEAGELEKAYSLYLAALEENSRSIDAVNGLGAIALRVGDAERAADWFRRSLQLDPNDAVALGGLSSLKPPAGNDESRLRTLIAAQPSAPALHFALGNVYAGESRWNEAQQAYFNAYSLEPANPDYRFNLAISLDRLGQQALARRFYLEASELARDKPAAFDPAAALARAKALATEQGK